MHILGFHFIFTAYGFWLPNDPRGSWSTAVRSFNLQAFGPATKVNTTRSVASTPHDHRARNNAKSALKNPPVRFNGHQALAIAQGYKKAIEEHAYTLHALTILPDHTHIIMAWHIKPVDEIAAHLKAKATRSLTDKHLHPFENEDKRPSPWARSYWCPFIKNADHMRQAINYVNQNPIKAGLPAQHWRFIKPYK